MTLPRTALRAALAPVCFLALSAPAGAAGLQEDLNATWRGAWSVVLPGTASDCDDRYRDNKVFVTRVLAPDSHPLPEGELGRVSKIDVKRSRVDVLVDIDEPLLISWTDGPFKLFSQVRCQIELEFEVPREWVKKGWMNEIEALLSGVLERHENRESVARSERWNRRRVERLPEGYDEIFMEYQRWKAAQLEGAQQPKD